MRLRGGGYSTETFIFDSLTKEKKFLCNWEEFNLVSVKAVIDRVEKETRFKREIFSVSCIVYGITIELIDNDKPIMAK